MGCTHNNEKAGENVTTWWKLEFASSVQIDWINIWNRIDTNGSHEHRIDGAEVIFNDPFKWFLIGDQLVIMAKNI
jgi:hypothetical protein